MNSANVTGRFAHDIEVGQLNNAEQTAVIETQLAVHKPRSRQPTFLNVVIYGSNAEAVAKYCKRGDLVAVTGYTENGEWRDSETDKPRSRQRIVAQQVDFLEPKRRQEPGDQPEQTERTEQTEPGDEGLPF